MYHNPRRTRATTGVAFAAALAPALAMTLGGCGQTRTTTLTSGELAVLTELDIGAPSSAQPIPPVLAADPSLSLVAGDRIAIQCAIAGGYFGMGNDAPVYATAPTIGFE